MKILGIETSCDETAAAVVEDGTTILSNVIASQVEIHSRYGGIVPEVASRQHLLASIPILKKALEDANVQFEDIDAIAVTQKREGNISTNTYPPAQRRSMTITGTKNTYADVLR